jgi:hypothetical protein
MRSSTVSLLVATGLLAFAGTGRAQTEAPPTAPFQMVSALVELPDFIPGLGILYVDPATLPAGPFFGYDRDGSLVNTVYMIPLSALTAQQSFEGLAAADAPVDHLDILYNAGHPGVAEPHYHVVIWHVSPTAAAALR